MSSTTSRRKRPRCSSRPARSSRPASSTSSAPGWASGRRRGRKSWASLPAADRPVGASSRPGDSGQPGALANWAGNQVYRARRVVSPRSIDELQEVIRQSRRLRPLGTRHAFSPVADTDGDLVSLAALPRRFELDPIARTVTIDGGGTYGDICARLDRGGFALHNLASLPHISVAGAIATATHGSGTQHGSLATAVVGLELVRADGEIERIGSAGADDRLAGATVSLGALGVVTA